MAKKKEEPVNRRMWMIDPIYKKFTAKAFENLTGTEFYQFFRTMLMNGEHEFQFSNRKLNMQVDERWVEIIEATIPSFVEIARNPRVIITQEELITNVVQAKKIDQQVVKHLCAHSYLVDAIDEDGNVVPNKVLNIFKEETWDTYENRFVYTLMKMTYDFITKRYQDMKEAMNDEFGATLIIKSNGQSAMENLNIDMKMKIKQVDDLFDKNAKHKNIFTRIEEIYEAMVNIMETTFAKTMSKFLKVTPPLVPTNAIKKNPHLRKCHVLWDFLLAYFDVGYTVEIIEQNPEINEKFEQDIWDDIMFTYIILKGYLEDNRDRAMDREVKSTRRLLRPRYIKEIVEELVQNFNMNDVEVRKVLIEELTKEQLMREEQSERYKLVEEQRQKKEEEKRQKELDKIRKAKEEEKARKLLEKQKERERIQAEKDRIRREEQKKKDALKREALDAKRTELFTAELAAALETVEKRHELVVKQRESLEKKAEKKKEKELEKSKKKAKSTEKSNRKEKSTKKDSTKNGNTPEKIPEEKKITEKPEELQEKIIQEEVPLKAENETAFEPKEAEETAVTETPAEEVIEKTADENNRTLEEILEDIKNKAEKAEKAEPKIPETEVKAKAAEQKSPENELDAKAAEPEIPETQEYVKPDEGNTKITEETDEASETETETSGNAEEHTDQDIRDFYRQKSILERYSVKEEPSEKEEVKETKKSLGLFRNLFKRK